ncbi:hypothetical protein GIB67_020194 [Kingdonia uniflora]|uniref:Uncharacterized protein n=1 Tax=Kingdonia uniflora TaxID=39325 RepID=A0A7J7NUH7_9MAGN|nr:hypothetical protein GIB67_020194 [Kingdonia uniflora]
MGKRRRQSREPGKENSNKKNKRLKRRKKGKGELQKKSNANKKNKKAEEADTMVVAEVAKINIVFFNQEEVIGEAYQASTDQTTLISVEEQTIEVVKTEDEASLASADQTTVVFVEKQTIEVVKIEVVISHQEEDVDEASQVIDVYSKALIQYFDAQHRAHPDKEKIVLADVFA